MVVRFRFFTRLLFFDFWDILRAEILGEIECPYEWEGVSQEIVDAGYLVFQERWGYLLHVQGF